MLQAKNSRRGRLLHGGKQRHLLAQDRRKVHLCMQYQISPSKPWHCQPPHRFPVFLLDTKAYELSLAGAGGAVNCERRVRYCLQPRRRTA